MGRLRFENKASWKLAQQITADATEIPVESSAGLPVLSDGDYFYSTLEEGQNIEVVRVTGIVLDAGTGGAILTVERGQDNTAAAPFNAFVKIEMRVNAAIMRDVIDERLALEERTIANAATDKQELTDLIGEAGGNAAGSTSQLVASAMHTVLSDETVMVNAGGIEVFSHPSDPHKMRSVFIEKEVAGAVTSIEVSSHNSLSNAGETILEDSIPMLATSSVTQTALNANEATTTALSFDGGVNYGDFSGDHGTVTIPEGCTDLKVKVNIGTVYTVSDTSNIYSGATIISGDPYKGFNHINDGSNVNPVLNSFEMTLGGECRFGNMKTAASATNPGGYPTRPFSVYSHDGTDWVLEYESKGTHTVVFEHIMSFTTSRLKVVGTGYIFAVLGTDFWAVESKTTGNFSSITFDKQTVSSWLLDDLNSWSVELSSATTTTVVNVGGEPKNARIRIGATGVLAYDYTRTIPAGRSETLQLPVPHGDDTVVHLKQYVPSGQVSETKWDFDVADAALWDGGTAEGGKIMLSGNVNTIANGQSEVAGVAAFTEGGTSNGRGLKHLLLKTGYEPFGGAVNIDGNPYTNPEFVIDAGEGNFLVIGDFRFETGGASPRRTNSFIVEISSDNISWVGIAQFDNVNYDEDRTLAMSASSRYVRIRALEHLSGTSGVFRIQHGQPETTFTGWDLKILSGEYDSSCISISLSSINTAITESISSVVAAELKPAGTDVRYALSFDGKDTWRTIDNAIVPIGEVATGGMTKAELEAFDFSGVTLGDALDVAIGMSTTDPLLSPSVDQISADMTMEGSWAHTAPDPDKYLVVDLPGDQEHMLVENKSDSEKTLKIKIEV